MTLGPQQRYVQRLLELYRATPETTGIARRTDRCLAANLFDRCIPLQTVHAALLLAASRRAHRPCHAPPLAPIATLHYFLPVIEELNRKPLDEGYLVYLRHAMLALAPTLAVFDPRIP